MERGWGKELGPGMDMTVFEWCQFLKDLVVGTLVGFK